MCIKKLIAIVILMALLVSVFGCGTKKEDPYDQWVEILDAYDRVMDRYIVICQRLSDDPSDYTVMSEYSQLTLDLADYADKASRLEDDAENMTDEEYADLCARLLAIEAKQMQNLYSLGNR